jgi:predicted TPR repeat methyltransferase
MTDAAHAIIDLYQRHAQAWAGDRGTRLIEGAWLTRFTNLMPPRPNILDLGCGSGDPIARALIGHGARLTGLDSSHAMTTMCAGKFPDHDWHTGDMRTLALGRHYDGILAWDSLFHLSPEDQRRMFPIFRAHAAPQAALMFTSGWSHGEAIGQFRGEALYHASLAPEEYRALLAADGFDIVAHVVKDPGCDRTIWLAQRNTA